MPRVLVISSQVACGHVGISAIIPAVHSLGHEIIALPSVLLSNHPGHPYVAGEHVLPKKLEEMIAALDNNGWLAGINCFLTGYLPSVEHVAVAIRTITRLKAQSPDAKIICDPVIGDETEKIYIDIKVAEAIREKLLPLSDIILPNAFELSWLTGTAINGEADVLRARQAFPNSTVLATSVPTDELGVMANVFSARSCAGDCKSVNISCRFMVHSHAPKGPGDFFSGLIVAGTAFDLATAQTSALVKLSCGKAHLEIAQQYNNWINVKPLPTIPIIV